MGDYAKSKQQAQPPLPDDKSVTADAGGDTDVKMSTKFMTKIGSPEQVRRMLLQKYGPRNVWGTASGRWFVRSTDSRGNFTPWTEASASDFSVPGILAGALPTAGGALGGALAAPAAAATGNPMIESAGVGLGTAAGEELNRGISEVFMGPRGESALEHAGSTAMAGAAGFAGAEIPRAAKGIFQASAEAFENSKLGRGMFAHFAGDVDQPLIDAAADMGIRLTPGESSKSPQLKQMMQFLRNAIGSSSEFAKFEGPRYELFTKYVNDYLDSIGKSTQRFKNLGEAFMNAVEGLRRDRLGTTDFTTGLKVSGVADQLFSDAYGIATKAFPARAIGNTGVAEALVDMKDVKDTAVELAENLSGMNVAAPKLFKLARTTEDTIGMSEFSDLRSDLMQLAKSKQIIGTRANRLATMMVGKMDQTLKAQAQRYGVADTFLPALEKARNYYEKAAKLFNEGIIAQVAQKSPTEVAKTIVTMNKAEDVRTVKNILMRKNPQLWNNVQASTIDWAMRFKPGVYSRAEVTKTPMVQSNRLRAWWTNILPEVKQSLFTAEQRRAIDKIALVGSEIPIGNLPQGWAGRTIAMSKGAAIATGSIEAGLAGLGFGAGMLTGHGAVVSGMIGLGTLWMLPKTVAKMALSAEGRALMGEGLQLSSSKLVTRPAVMAKYMTRLTTYMLSHPEYTADMKEAQKRIRAGMMLSANGLKTDEENVNAFLEKNPNFK